MTAAPIPLIDWRRQWRELEPYLDHRGGVVHVRASTTGPASTFSKAIRQLMAEDRWPQPWKSVQVDPLNPNTHYLEDVAAQLDRSLGLGIGTSPVSAGSVQVGTGNNAQTVEISNVQILRQEDEFVRTTQSYERLDLLAGAIEERLQTERIALLFLNSHEYDRQALSRFRTLLWEGHLQALTEQGLLLIDISDPALSGSPEWPPDPNLRIELPDRFDESSRAEAHEDLAKLALDQKLVANAGEADVFAKTLLHASDTIVDLYANLASMRMSATGLE